MRTEISIDKLSFTARELNGSNLQEYLSSSVLNCRHYRTPNHHMYSDNFHFEDGSLVQFGMKSKDSYYRLEFNPNKCDWKVINSLIDKMRNPNITRVDYAIDIFDYDFTDTIFEEINKRKKVEYTSRSGKRETLYHGNPRTSDNFVRMYNKALERARKDDNEEMVLEEQEDAPRSWWRFEAVRKDFDKNEDMLWNPFQFILNENRMVFKKEEQFLDLKVTEKAMVFYLFHNPDAWQELSYNSKKKYEEMMFIHQYEMLPNEMQPNYIFDKEKETLTHEILSWLQPAFRNSINITGMSEVSPDKNNRGQYDDTFIVDKTIIEHEPKKIKFKKE